MNNPLAAQAAAWMRAGASRERAAVSAKRQDWKTAGWCYAIAHLHADRADMYMRQAMREAKSRPTMMAGGILSDRRSG